MTELSFNDPEFPFDELASSATKSLNKARWAELVFMDPLSVIPKFSLASTYAETCSDNELSALYADWQTRESEIGFGLVEQRKPEFRKAIELYHSVLDRRQRALAFSRARLQAALRINSTEPDTSLHYPPTAIGTIENEIFNIELELKFLRSYDSRIAALTSVIEVLHQRDELVEQYCRLLGQNWRGLMKLRAYEKKFSRNLTTSERKNTANRAIYHIAQICPLKTDISISSSAEAYLRHLLTTILLLKEKAATLFDAQQQQSQLEANWPPIMQMLSSIVELFYFCSFELPYASHEKVVDLTDAKHVWNFSHETNQWQLIEEPSLDRLRRQAAEATALLEKFPAFLRCSNLEEFTKSCRIAAQKESVLDSNFGAYRFAGLASIQYRSEAKTFRFQTSIPLIGEVLKQIIDDDESIQTGFYSACGGPLDTLLALAKLDSRAFGLAEDALNPTMAYKLLANFWKRMGKARPVSLLGESYAKEVYSGLASIGESAPERSSLLSIHLTNIFNNSLFGSKGPKDLLTVLMLADQIRLMDLLELSWSYAQAVILDLQNVKQVNEIGELISNGGHFAHFESEIGKRFNPKWLSATQPLWTILRSAAPHAWGLWTKLAVGNSVAKLLAKVEPAQALGFLLLPLADVVRLMVLFETSSPVLAERQKVDAETAARELLSGFSLFRNWPEPIKSIINENLGYYFDSQIQHDAWLAFTESLKEQLDHLLQDLQNRNAAATILEMLGTVLERLEANYPSISQKQTTVPVQLSDISIPDCEVMESDSRLLLPLSQAILGQKSMQHLALLKLLNFWRFRGLQPAMKILAYLKPELDQLIPDAEIRSLLTHSVPVFRVVSRALLESEDIDSEKLDQILNSVATELKREKQIEATLGLATLPFAIDRDRLLALTVKTDGERVNLLMVAIGQQLCFIALEQSDAKAAWQRFITELKERTTRQFPDWQPEPIALGAISLCASQAGLSLSNAALEVDPIFLESDKPSSARLLWMFASYKFALALKLLQAELPDTIIGIRL